MQGRGDGTGGTTFLGQKGLSLTIFWSKSGHLDLF